MAKFFESYKHHFLPFYSCQGLTNQNMEGGGGIQSRIQVDCHIKGTYSCKKGPVGREKMVQLSLDIINHLGVSKNRGGPPESSILIGFSIINYKPSILGYPYFWKHPFAACERLKTLWLPFGHSAFRYLQVDTFERFSRSATRALFG